MLGHDDVALVEAARAGDPVAFGRLFDRWFDRTYDVARHIVRNPDTAAEIAQDSFLTAWQQLATLRQPASFGGWVLRIARNRALNRLEHERRSVPGGDDMVAALLDRRAEHGDSATDIATDLAHQERDDLVWAAAAALGERDASLLDLHLRHDLGAAAIAEELDTSTNNVHQLLHRLRGRLGGAIRSWVLWRDGRARCDRLAGAIGAAGVTRFGPEAVRVISGHAGDCEVCSEAQRAVLAPEALFAAVPVIAAPVALKAQTASALTAAGVPLGSAVSRLAPPPATDAPAGGTPATGTGTAAPVPGAGGASPRPLRARRALRSATRGRRLAVAGAAVVALAAATTAVVLSRSPADRGDGQATEEAGATAGGGGPAGGAADAGGSGAAVAGESSTTSTPTPTPTPTPTLTTSVGGAPGSGGAPGAGTDGGDQAGTPGPGGSGGPGGSEDPGVPGGGTTTTGPGGPAVPPGSTTTTTSTASDPGADPPAILSFSATVGAPCGQLPLLRTVVLTWASVGGESASLGLLGIVGQDVPPSGSRTRCVLLGDVYLLTVSGPGGRDRARLTIAL